MQPVISIGKKTLKQSTTIYPKKQSTYIVAFAVSENMKTPSTELVHETGLRKSITVTPSTSSKTFTIKSSKQNIVDIPTENSSMTQVKEYCGDVERRSSNTLNNILDYLKINEVTSQPQVIFVAQKHVRKPNFDTEMKYKKLKKWKPVVVMKNIHFKNQRTQNMTTKLKRYCKKSKRTFDGSNIHKEIDSESISERVSRTRILKKVLAKENLAKAETNINCLHETNSPFNDNSSFISISSQDTLKQEDSPHSVSSIIEVRDLKITSFNNHIINVAVAQISNTPNLKRKSYSVIVPHMENADFKDSLTSYESAFSQTLMLTSKSFLDDATKLTSKTAISDASCSNISNETLIPPKTKSEISRDTFESRLRSHETNNNNTLSSSPKCSFINQSQDYRSLNSCHISDVKEKDLHTRTFYDACMTFNVYPRTRACSSSVPDFPNNDNVIIAEDKLKTTHQIQKMKNRGDERFGNIKNEFRANIFQKPFSVVNSEDYQKNLNLPNAAQIKSNIVDPSRPPRKCSQEVNEYPTSFPELCDKLTIILEIAVKKLEQTLSEKIVNELKRSLYEIDKHIQSITKLQEDTTSECIAKNMKLRDSIKSKVTLQPEYQTDGYVQCDIVQNEVIDKIMLNFNEEYCKSCVQSSSSNYTHKLKKPKLVKDYFDILKNSLSSHYKEQEIGKGDSIQISIEDSVEEKVPHFECKKTFWTIPVTILRENMFVVAGVPAFLFVMFVLYSYIMLLIRMWWY